VLLAPSWERQPDRYLRGQFEPVRSGLAEPRALAEHIIVEVASGMSRDEAQLRRALAGSLAHRQGRLPDVRGCIATMLESGMLTETADERTPTRQILKASRLGRIAVRQLLSPSSVLHLAQLVGGEDAYRFTLFDLLLIAVSAPDCEPLIPADFEELEALADTLRQEPTTLLAGVQTDVTTRLQSSGKRFLAILKTALIARSWTRTGYAAETADEFGCYPFEVRRLSESLERLLTALVAVLTPAKQPSEVDDASTTRPDPFATDTIQALERARALLAMVAHGLDEETVTLTYIEGIGGTLARRLQAAGITDIETLAQAEPADIDQIQGISQQRAERWIAEATALLPQISPWRLREDRSPTTVTSSSWPRGIDPYRLGRAQTLIVVPQGRSRFIVTGGLEPHVVAMQPPGAGCDCADHRAGRTCKHILAVRLHEGDPLLSDLIRRLSEGASPMGTLDLQSLWFDQLRRCA
jgi:helicase